MPNPTTSDLDLIGSDESSQICGVDRATFLRWREAGLIAEAAKIPGPNGAYMFRRSDVEALAAEKAKAS